jgi:hypothetical protein
MRLLEARSNENLKQPQPGRVRTVFRAKKPHQYRSPANRLSRNNEGKQETFQAGYKICGAQWPPDPLGLSQ